MRRRLDPLPSTDARLHDLRHGVLVPVAGWRRGHTRGSGALNLAATHAIVRRACVVVPRRAGLRLRAPEPAWHADVAPLHQATRSQRAASGKLAGLSCPCAAPHCERRPGRPAGAATEPTRVPHGFAHEQLQQTCCAGHGDERHLAILTMPIFSDSIGTTSTSIVPIFVALQGLETVRNTRQTAFVVKSSSCMALGRFFPFFFPPKAWTLLF